MGAKTLSDDFEIERACTVALCVKPEAEGKWDSASELIKDKEFELSGPNNIRRAKGNADDMDGAPAPPILVVPSAILVAAVAEALDSLTSAITPIPTATAATAAGAEVPWSELFNHSDAERLAHPVFKWLAKVAELCDVQLRPLSGKSGSPLSVQITAQGSYPSPSKSRLGATITVAAYLTNYSSGEQGSKGRGHCLTLTLRSGSGGGGGGFDAAVRQEHACNKFLVSLVRFPFPVPKRRDACGFCEL